MANTSAGKSPAETGDELLRRNRELTILNKIAEALNRSIDLDQTLRSALAQVAELLDLQTGWIWLLDEHSAQPYLAAAQNLPPGLIQNPRLMEGSCYCLDTYRAGDLDGAANVNVLTCSRLRKLISGTGGLRYHASIPLYAHGKQLGVLNVASPDWRQLSAQDLRLLYTVGDLLSIAIERARLFSRSAEFGAAEERTRLAREIHDTLAQGLAGIALKLETADALLEGGASPQRVQDFLRQALDLARSNLDEARRSVMDLRAAPLEGRTLDEALQALAENNAAKASIPVTFTASGAARPLPARVEMGIYRVAQEAVNNAIQHARPQHIRLHLTFAPDHLQLTVEDDGLGFDPSGSIEGHFGLLGLNERIRLLGGSLSVESAPRQGTQVTARIPL